MKVKDWLIQTNANAINTRKNGVLNFLELEAGTHVGPIKYQKSASG
jgi:hypothetical protein